MGALAAVLVVVLAGGAVSPTPGVCVCEAARADGGWCDVHGLGHLGGSEVRSKVLFEVLDAHGHEVDPTTFECPSCQAALAEDGFCGPHRVGFVGGLAYFSRLSYLLAAGERRDPRRIECPVCRRNAASRGWCAACNVGMLGAIAIDDRGTFDELVGLLAIVARADEAAPRCVHCAAAIVTDTECPICRITYRGGAAVTP